MYKYGTIPVSSNKGNPMPGNIEGSLTGHITRLVCIYTCFRIMKQIASADNDNPLLLTLSFSLAAWASFVEAAQLQRQANIDVLGDRNRDRLSRLIIFYACLKMIEKIIAQRDSNSLFLNLSMAVLVATSTILGATEIYQDIRFFLSHRARQNNPQPLMAGNPNP